MRFGTAILLGFAIVACATPVPHTPVVVQLPREVEVYRVDGRWLEHEKELWLGLEPGHHRLMYHLYFYVETAGGLYHDIHHTVCETSYDFEKGAHRLSLRVATEKSSVTVPAPEFKVWLQHVDSRTELGDTRCGL